MRVLPTVACLLIVYLSDIGLPTVDDETWRTSVMSTPPPDSQEVLAEIHKLEGVLPNVPDQAAALFLLATKYAQLGDTGQALALLKRCMAFDAGFVPDPATSHSLMPLESNSEFRQLLAEARRRQAPVHKARVAFTVSARDLFPEGLAVDADQRVFYMGSMHRKKILKFALNEQVSDFVKQDVYDLSPVGGVHVDTTDHSIWAATDAGEKHRPELLHFDAQGRLLERYQSPGKMPHDLNDFVLRGAREIFATDTEGHHVYRFDRVLHAFRDIKLWRPVFYPNGITLSGDGKLLFIADMLGVIRVDLDTYESADVDPGPHNTLCGIDGLYWHNGEFLGVQYGTGEYRVVRWWLSPDERRAVSKEILEYGTDLVSDPTTGAIFGGNFYYIANTGIYNLENDKIIDPAKLEPVHVAAVRLDP
jgi:sugar lactone lactonase YvrE